MVPDCFNHHQESNNAFLVTDEGVLVIDAPAPQRAEELLATIRKYTDKPIASSSHAHGDHYASVFAREAPLSRTATRRPMSRTSVSR